MPELDFGNIYSPSGRIIQQRYAQKAVDAGSTILAMRSKGGIVIAVSKPRRSKLHVHESDYRVRRVAENACMAYTGILTDGAFVHSICKKAARNYKTTYGTETNGEHMKKTLHEYLHMFTRDAGLRVIGACFVAAVRDHGEYKLLLGESNGKVSKWNACAAGAGEKRAYTELEKLQLDSMSVEDMVDQSVMILYKCFDALSDAEFDIEVGYMSDEHPSLARVDGETLAKLTEKYQDINVDE